MRALAAALLLCCAALAQERAFVEVTAPKDAVYVGEPVTLTLRLGYDREFFRAHAVPLFPRRADVLLHVEAQVPGEPLERGRGPTFALNDAIVHAEPLPDETRGGRAFAVLAWRRRLVPAGAGEVKVPAPTLRYVHATVFEEDFVAGRIAKDPKHEVMTGRPLVLRILPLPAERPGGFEGAVGRFTIEARCDRTTVDAGAVFRLTVAIRGEGNARMPRLELPGFHVFGTVLDDEGRTAVHDVAALSAGVKEVPSIPFAFFDPGAPAYRIVRTDPIPLEVRPRAGETPPPPPAGGPTSVVPLVAGGLLLAVVALALALWLRRRSAREAPPDPEAVRLREAFAALRARAGSGGPDLCGAFAGFLAAYLKCPPAAVIGPDLALRLVAKGFPGDLASRAAATLERLVAARYGAKGGGADDFAGLLAAIEAVLPTAR